MRKLIVAVVLAVLATGLAVAGENPEQTAVMNTVQQFVSGFNHADSKSALAMCAPQTAIIDDFPPHNWATCSAWLNDYNAWTASHGVSNGTLTLGDAKHVDITGEQAYVVVGAIFSSLHEGKTMTEDGLMTLVLEKGTAGWRIVAWTWTTR